MPKSGNAYGPVSGDESLTVISPISLLTSNARGDQYSSITPDAKLAEFIPAPTVRVAIRSYSTRVKCSHAERCELESLPDESRGRTTGS